MEDVKDGLAESIQNELHEIITVPTVRMNHNVLRVPEHIRKLNRAAYEPQLISIGPVFHGRSDLKPMEAYKKRYARNFIEKYELKIQELIDITKEHERMFREAYGMESSEISSDKLVKIMIIDGAFLVEFLLRHYHGTFEEMDRMTYKKQNMFTCDLLLLENQIPFSYLESCHLKEIVYSGRVMLQYFLEDTVLPKFVFGRRYSIPRDNAYEPKHLLDSLSKKMKYEQFERSKPKTSSSASCPTVSQLHRTGIKFTDTPWLNIKPIDFKGGTLELRRFTINENTLRYFANLLAFELYQEEDRFATDYIALLDYLIDGPEDVKILVENDILENSLEDDKAAADVINEIGRSIDVSRDFQFSDLVENLNAHHKKVWNKWRSTYFFEWKRDLRKNYFSNPWTTLSVIAAILLLGFTVAQTVFSYLQLKQDQ